VATLVLATRVLAPGRAACRPDGRQAWTGTRRHAAEPGSRCRCQPPGSSVRTAGSRAAWSGRPSTEPRDVDGAAPWSAPSRRHQRPALRHRRSQSDVPGPGASTHVPAEVRLHRTGPDSDGCARRDEVAHPLPLRPRGYEQAACLPLAPGGLIHGWHSTGQVLVNSWGRWNGVGRERLTLADEEPFGAAIRRSGCGGAPPCRSRLVREMQMKWSSGAGVPETLSGGSRHRGRCLAPCQDGAAVQAAGPFAQGTRRGRRPSEGSGRGAG
jgi:hypothetical protein